MDPSRNPSISTENPVLARSRECKTQTDVESIIRKYKKQLQASIQKLPEDLRAETSAVLSQSITGLDAVNSKLSKTSSTGNSLSASPDIIASTAVPLLDSKVPVPGTLSPQTNLLKPATRDVLPPIQGTSLSRRQPVQETIVNPSPPHAPKKPQTDSNPEDFDFIHSLSLPKYRPRFQTVPEIVPIKKAPPPPSRTKFTEPEVARPSHIPVVSTLPKDASKLVSVQQPMIAAPNKPNLGVFASKIQVPVKTAHNKGKQEAAPLLEYCPQKHCSCKKHHFEDVDLHALIDTNQDLTKLTVKGQAILAEARYGEWSFSPVRIMWPVDSAHAQQRSSVSAFMDTLRSKDNLGSMMGSKMSILASNGRLQTLLDNIPMEEEIDFALEDYRAFANMEHHGASSRRIPPSVPESFGHPGTPQSVQDAYVRTSPHSMVSFRMSSEPTEHSGTNGLPVAAISRPGSDAFRDFNSSSQDVKVPGSSPSTANAPPATARSRASSVDGNPFGIDHASQSNSLPTSATGTRPATISEMPELLEQIKELPGESLTPVGSTDIAGQESDPQVRNDTQRASSAAAVRKMPASTALTEGRPLSSGPTRTSSEVSGEVSSGPSISVDGLGSYGSGKALETVSSSNPAVTSASALQSSDMPTTHARENASIPREVEPARTASVPATSDPPHSALDTLRRLSVEVGSNSVSAQTPNQDIVAGIIAAVSDKSKIAPRGNEFLTAAQIQQLRKDLISARSLRQNLATTEREVRSDAIMASALVQTAESSNSGTAAKQFKGAKNLEKIVHSKSRTKEDIKHVLLLTDPIVEGNIEQEIQKLKGSITDMNEAHCDVLTRIGFLQAQNGSYEEAKRYLTQAITNDPELDAYWIRAQVHVAQNNPTAALADLDTVTTKQRLHFTAWLAKARIYKQQNNNKMAIQSYDMCVKVRPKAIEPIYERGRLHEIEGNMMAMDADFRHVLKYDPTNKHALFSTSVQAFNKTLWSEAIAGLTRLLLEDADNVQAYIYRGRAHGQAGHWEESLSDLTNAVRLAPSDPEVYFLRGCLFSERNRPRAIRDFSVSLLLDDTGSNADSYFYRGLCYCRMKLYDLALADYHTAIELNPTKPLPYINLAILYAKLLGKYEQALGFINEGIKRAPNVLRAYTVRSEIHLFLHRMNLESIADERMFTYKTAVSRRKRVDFVSLAISDYNKAIHLHPTDPYLYLARGRLLLKQFKTKEAGIDFKAAWILNQGRHESLLKRLLVLAFQNRYKDLIRAFDHALEKKEVYFENHDVTIPLLGATSKIKVGDFNGAMAIADGILAIRPEEMSMLLVRGICFAATDNHKKAIADFTKVISSDKALTGKAYYHRGLCRIKEKDSRGLQDLSRAIRANPRYFEAYIARAAYYKDTGDYKFGVEDCCRAARLDPSSLQVYLLRGIILTKMEMFDEALRDLKTAASLDPTCAVVYSFRAITYHVIGSYEQALKYYSIAIMLNKGNSYAYRNRGVAYWKMGDYVNAMLDFYAAWRFSPTNVEMTLLLGHALVALGRLKESIAVYTATIQLRPLSEQGYLTRGNVYTSLGDYENARADYSKALHLNPRCADAYINLAYLFQAHKHYQKALDTYNTLLAINKKFLPALEGRAVLYLVLDFPMGAIVDLTRALSIDPQNAELYTNRGVIYQILKDFKRAFKDYKAAIAVDPDLLVAQFNAGNLYIRQQNYEMALQSFTKVLEKTPEDGMARLNRGITYCIMRDFANAEKDMNESMLHHSSPHLVYLNRAKLYEIMEKYEKAEEDYETVIRLQPALEPALRMILLEVRRRKVPLNSSIFHKDTSKAGLLRAELKEYAKTLKS